MTLFFIVICFVCLWHVRIKTPFDMDFNQNYLAVDRTNCIKGIFILMVFLSHSRNYLSKLPEYTVDPLNSIYDVIQNHLGQGIVVMFLFYSGYGVMESILKKGSDYINAFPKQRFAKTLFHFDIAVMLFVIVDLCLGTLNNYSILEVLLSFTGWESVGNSNWYIFAILILYLITYFAFKIFKDKTSKAVWLVTVLTVVYIAVLALAGKDAWWFDTVLLYPLGMWYSVGKDKIENFVRKKPINYFGLLILCCAVFIVSHLLRSNIICYEISQVALCAVIVAATMKIDINNKILEFFGKHLFEIYILMRIPMNVLLHFDIDNVYVFVSVSFAVTLLLAVLLKKVFTFSDRFLFAKNKKQ